MANACTEGGATPERETTCDRWAVVEESDATPTLIQYWTPAEVTAPTMIQRARRKSGWARPR